MKKVIKKLWSGNETLARSFWLYYFIFGSILSLPLFYFTDARIDAMSGGAVALLLIYELFFFVALVIIIVGTWRSAAKYKIAKRKKKQSTGWGIAAQVYIIFAVITALSEILSSF